MLRQFDDRNIFFVTVFLLGSLGYPNALDENWCIGYGPVTTRHK